VVGTVVVFDVAATGVLELELVHSAQAEDVAGVVVVVHSVVVFDVATTGVLELVHSAQADEVGTVVVVDLDVALTDEGVVVVEDVHSAHGVWVVALVVAASGVFELVVELEEVHCCQGVCVVAASGVWVVVVVAVVLSTAPDCHCCHPDRCPCPCPCSCPCPQLPQP